MKAKEKFEKTQALVVSGTSVKSACKKTGLSTSTYGYYKYKAGKPKGEPELITMPRAEQPIKAVIIQCLPSQLGEMLRNLS